MNIYLFAFVMCIILYFYALASTNFVIVKQKTTSPTGTNIEGFAGNSGDYCESCDNMSFGQCMKCYNCGFCGDKYSGKCVKGTFVGPNKTNENESTVIFDKQNNTEPYCPNYYHNDDFWRYLNVSKDYNDINIAKPFNL